MPIKLITGQPGNGKTLYAVHLINQALKDGREVYTNINGISLDVLPIPENARGELDWSLTPKGDATLGLQGALIVYDETQKLPYFAYKKEKLSANPLISELETHRHDGYDLIFVTQSPKFLHLHLLELVNEHYHVKRPFNRKQAEIHMHRKACMLPETEAAEKRAEDVFKFAYPLDLFKYYKSTEIVTNSKIRIPKYMKKLFIIGGLCTAGIVFTLGFTDNKIFNHVKGEGSTFGPKVPETKTATTPNVFGGLDSRTPEQREAERKENYDKTMQHQKDQLIQYNISKPYDAVEVSYQATAKPVFSGCMKKNGKYYAYTQQGTPLSDVSQNDCKRLIEDGDRPFNYFATDRTGFVSTDSSNAESTQQTQPNL